MDSLDVESVVALLEKWNLDEFTDFVREKQIDGRKLSNVTEGFVKLWQPKCNAEPFMIFLQDLKTNQEKYLVKNVLHTPGDANNKLVESQYQTVRSKRNKEETVTTNTDRRVDELLKKLVPTKSFLYRNQQKQTEKNTFSYVSMNGATQKKSRNFFRMCSFEYPYFDFRSRFSKTDNFNDRGYYTVKTNTIYCQKTCTRAEARPKRISLATPEELIEKVPEDHLYEDLCYTDTQNDNTSTEINLNPRNNVSIKPCIVKLQELFQSFKFPFFKRSEEMLKEETKVVCEREGHIYENSDGIANMYDSVHVQELTSGVHQQDTHKRKTTLPVEEYLVPIVVEKEYCDVNYDQKGDSLLDYIMSALENRFGFRRESNEPERYVASDSDLTKGACDPVKPCGSDQKRNEDKKLRKTNMADRPLPVPVENEPYFMNIDRAEAENLLKGQPDGTFLLRPSSQPQHVYTLSVCCAGGVHNVGVRRRAGGELALGFGARGGRGFPSVSALVRHHARRRLLLLAGSGVLGATTLADCPQYYHTPTNIPVHTT